MSASGPLVLRLRLVLLVAVCMACAFSLALTGCGGGNSAATGGTGTSSAVGVTIAGAAQTRLGQATQFTATISNSTNTAVTWQVNGTAGGSTAAGIISSTGLYTAPAALPSPVTVTITAVSQATPSASASVSEAIWNPVPVVASAAATQLGTSANYLVDVRGNAFVVGAQIAVGGTTVTTSYISGTELQATATPAAGATSLAVSVVNPNPGSAVSATLTAQVTAIKATVAQATRLLDQTGFGPTLADIQHVQAVGLDAYLTEQFTATPTALPDLPNPLPAQCFPSNPRPCEESEWWSAAMTAPDQLRQRVALALAEMFVVSTNSVSPYAVTPYQNLLTKDAFGNFATMMKDVTLSPAMGAYLNMLNSYKPGNGQIANENFARELMQLFTTGIYQLNQDGTPKLDATGNMIPVYTQAQVQAFARAFTGWTYATSTGGVPAKFPNGTPSYDYPMAALESAHDTTAKTLLDGTVLPAGQTSAQDLTGALTNLFNNTSTGPFVCRQLIQHLVASNPSPAYVARVSAVFADDGTGVRGNLRAVLRAILLDKEARAGDSDPTQDGGHLREPMLYLSAALRGLGAVNTDATGYYGTLSNYSSALSQRPYGSSSVFNFFPPEYVIPGTSVNAPEFGLENTASAILRLTLADQIVYNRIGGFKIDLSATSALGLLASNPGNLVDALGVLFLHGQMPAAMRTAIVNHIATLSDAAQRARVATYLVLSSSEYKIEH